MKSSEAVGIGQLYSAFPKRCGIDIARRLRALIFAGLLLFDGACGKVDEVNDTLRQAIATLTVESGKWREVLLQLEQKLKEDGSDLLGQVDTIAQKAIAASGSQVPCVVDFIGKRVKEQIENVLRSQTGQPLAVLPPYICATVPDSVDLTKAIAERKVTTLYGYDLDMMQPSRLRALLVNRAGETVDVSEFITTPSHYQMVLNTASGGVAFTDTSQKLILELPTTPPVPVSSFPVVRHPVKPPVQMFPASGATGGRSDNATSVAGVPTRYRLIGGGCRSDAQGRGQLMWASYPVGDTWRCGTKAHADSDPATVTAFAIGVPDSSAIEVHVTEPVAGTRIREIPPAVGNYYEARAELPANYVLVGGGCRVGDASWDAWPGQSYAGNYIVKSFGDGVGWRCEAKDHNGARSDVNVYAYAIGVRSSADKLAAVEIVQSDEARYYRADGVSNHLTVDTKMWNGDTGIALVGGGCKVDYDLQSAGNLMRSSYPVTGAWECSSKDHQVVTPATLTARAYGIRYMVP